MIISYILMILSFTFLLLNGLQGFFGFSIYKANHIAFAFFSTILYMFTQTLIMFYFIGAGKKIKETIIENNLKKETYKEVIELKRRLFTPLTLNMLFVGIAFILGGAVHTGGINKLWHSGFFILSIIHYLKVIIIQHNSFIENNKTLLKVGEELLNQNKG